MQQEKGEKEVEEGEEVEKEEKCKVKQEENGKKVWELEEMKELQ